MRLIDADAFAVFSYKGTEGYADCFDGGVLFTLERLDKAPTIDAEPIRHGHWIDGVLITDASKYNAVGCSACRQVFNYPNAKDLVYCPACGAKMDEN